MSGGESRKKGKERGLWYEIACLEDVIEAKEKSGQDASFEKELLEAYKKSKPEDYHKMLDGQS